MEPLSWNERPRVAVIGAGMAGLAAAHALQRAGLQVRVIEQDSAVGGRVQSRPFHGRTIECGAQFPSTGYRHVPGLLAQAGLAGRVVPTSPWAASEREGRLCRFHQHRPWSLACGGLLRWPEWGRLAWGALQSAGAARGLDLSSYAAFAPLDDEDARDWSVRTFGQAATRHMLEPAIHGLYFHPLPGASKALLSAVLAFRGATTLAVREGWNVLPRWMASGLDVRTGQGVDALVETPHGVQVWTGRERFDAHWAVLAVPSPVARRLLPAPDLAERALLETPYASAIHVALGMHPDWRAPQALRGVHGLLFAPGGEDALAAAMVLESARLPVRAPEVVTVMLGDAQARAAALDGDLAVVERVRQWLDLRWPGMGAQAVAHHVTRWAHAEPLSPVGRARAIERYRAGMAAQRRIVLCGDYMGMPWTDGAVETGLWAARHIGRASGRQPLLGGT
jgi:oxygen-dependent protoporphyrinogen oxidase